MVDSIAFALATGNAPGRPRQTGQVCVFGSAPNSVEQPQNIFDDGAEFDVGLQPDHRLVPGERLVVA